MYPTLSHLIKDLTGVWIPLPFATFGFFVALAIIAASFFLRAELKRKERSGLLNPFFNKRGDCVRPFETVGTLTLIAVLTGLVGARIFSVLEDPAEFQNDPLTTLFSASGLTFYGGLIFGSISVLLYAKRKHLKIIHLLDAFAPALMLAYALGRIGCQLSGDGDWGIDNLAAKPSWLRFAPDWAWAYSYPQNVINEGVLIQGCEGEYCHVLQNPVFPTPLYETIICLLLFILLWTVRNKVQTAGLLFSFYLILNGLERFLIEKIRIDPDYRVFGLYFKQAELISIFLILLGTGLGASVLAKKQLLKNEI